LEDPTRSVFSLEPKQFHALKREEHVQTNCGSIDNRNKFHQELKYMNWNTLYRMDDVLEQYRFEKNIDRGHGKNNALESRDETTKRQLRNIIHRKSKHLEYKYYKESVEPTKCAKKTFQALGKLTETANISTLDGLCNTICDGHLETFVNKVNILFQSVSSHLPLLPVTEPSSHHLPDKYTASVHETQKMLDRIMKTKSTGPDGIPKEELNCNYHLYSSTSTIGSCGIIEKDL